MTGKPIRAIVPVRPEPGQLSQQVQVRFQQALDLHQRGDFDQAQSLYQSVLKLQPKHFDSQHMLGVVALQTGRFERSTRELAEAIKLNPFIAAVHNNRGYALKQLKRYKEALASFERALQLQPAFAEAHNNQGYALLDLERFDEALASLDRALAIKPDYPEALYNRGNALKGLKRYTEALATFDSVLEARPDFAEAHNNRGVVLLDLKREKEAGKSFEQALVLKPDYAEAHSNLGYSRSGLRQFDLAMRSYERALHFQPDLAIAHNGRGLVLIECSLYTQALSSFEQALLCKPDYAQAHVGRASALIELKRLDEAAKVFKRALALKPDLDFIFGAYLDAKMKICDWIDWAESLERVRRGIEKHEKVSHPFSVLSWMDEPELHKMAAELYAKENYPECHDLGALERRASGGKIRVGYYSADFFNHATSILMIELFEVHDRERFEWIGFSFGPKVQDAMRTRVEAAFDRFLDVTGMSDLEVAELSRSMGIDIAVDLKGYTKHCRTGIFARRAAPIQVNYLGYPGTMGSSYCDYLIADHTVIPDDSRAHYSEKMVYLPHSYQVNDSKRPIAERVFSRSELGLPEQGFVFCCFNNNYKILPTIFDGWMRILNAVPGSVLWLYEANAVAADNLRKQAQLRGVAASRLVFAKFMDHEQHLARYRAADLFIDTFPYNAHTTSSDALWAGLPVLTLCGRSFASRVGASLLHAVGLPELIAGTQQQYEDKAIELASHPALLDSIRERLSINRQSAAVFNGRQFAKDVESAYLAMHERHCAGLAPEVIVV